MFLFTERTLKSGRTVSLEHFELYFKNIYISVENKKKIVKEKKNTIQFDCMT